jgi:hypothetical protein
MKVVWQFSGGALLLFETIHHPTIQKALEVLGSSKAFSRFATFFLTLDTTTHR